MLKFRFALLAAVIALGTMLLPIFGQVKKHPGLDPIQYAHAEALQSDSKPLESLLPVPVDAKSIAQNKAASRGWTGAEWEALIKLWTNESNWNPNAVNKSSGACGIPQALPCNKIPNPSSVFSQIDWGLDYIKNRYGSPSKALTFWNAQSPHWY